VTHIDDSTSVSVGKDLIVGYDPNDLGSRADAIQVVFEAKMATIDRELNERSSAISKAAIPDLVKAHELRVLADAAEHVRAEVIKQTRTDIEDLKQQPAPAKGFITERRSS
jgi:hypothetical protein